MAGTQKNLDGKTRKAASPITMTNFLKSPLALAVWVLWVCCSGKAQGMSFTPPSYGEGERPSVEELLRHTTAALAVGTQGYALNATLTEPFYEDAVLKADIHLERWQDAALESQMAAGVLVHGRLDDGKTMLFADGYRIRHPQAKDVIDVRREHELLDIVFMHQVTTDRFELSVEEHPGIVENERCHQLKLISRKTGLTYYLLVDTKSWLPRFITLSRPIIYNGKTREELVETWLYKHRGEPPHVPADFQMKVDNVLQTTLTIHDFSLLTEDPDCWSREAFSQAISRYQDLAPTSEAERLPMAQQAKEALEKWFADLADIRVVKEKLVALGNTELYARAIMHPQTSVLVSEARVDPHSDGHYMPMDLDLSGTPRRDVLTLRRPPAEIPLSLMHETTHLILRSSQAHAPLLVRDDEDACVYQEDLYHTIAAMKRLEESAFPIPENPSGRWKKSVTSLWHQIHFRVKHAIASNQISPGEAIQLKHLTGMFIDLPAIRQYYLDAGIPEDCLPNTLKANLANAVKREQARQIKVRNTFYQLSEQD